MGSSKQRRASQPPVSAGQLQRVPYVETSNEGNWTLLLDHPAAHIAIVSPSSIRLTRRTLDRARLPPPPLSSKVYTYAFDYVRAAIIGNRASLRDNRAKRLRERCVERFSLFTPTTKERKEYLEFNRFSLLRVFFFFFLFYSAGNGVSIRGTIKQGCPEFCWPKTFVFSDWNFPGDGLLGCPTGRTDC